MNNNAWFKKENPLLSLQSMSGGAAGSLMQGAATKTYVDEVFSPYVYVGNGNAGASQNINNGIDLSGEGGMVWAKSRDVADEHDIFDTVRGHTKRIRSEDNSAEATLAADSDLTSFNSDGFSLGPAGSAKINWPGNDLVSWSFRKAKGFFDIVTYTGDGVNGRTVSHSLGSVPGMIFVKNLTDTDSWAVYHRDIGNTHALRLDTTAAAQASANWWYNTTPTSTEFTLGYGGEVNGNGSSYVAYVFAGGDVVSGTSADIDITSKTVTNLGGNFDGSYPMSNMTDGTLETSNATNMAYVNASANPSNPDMDVYVDLDTPHVVTKYRIGPQGGNGTSGYNLVNNFNVYGTNDTSSWNFVAAFAPGQSGWSGGNYRDFEFGNEISYRYWRIQVTQGDSGNNKAISEWKIQGYSAAVDTSSYVFGEDGDKNIISCGNYTGNGSDDGPQINCGWEPQWILLKRTDSTDNWPMYDVMRGIATGGTDNQLRADQNAVEHTTGTTVDVTSTGFKITTLGSEVNANNGEYVYMAIRRPDGYVGKPPSAGTDVFAMDTGAGSSTIPNFDSTFPVDFGLVKLLEPWNATEDWYACNRLITKSFVQPSNQGAQGGAASMNFDSNLGWSSESSWSNFHQSWMWKRGQGMDVVAYSGNGVDGRNLNHSLNQAPQMIWIKNRTDSGNTGDWMVGHKDLNGGSSPWNYYLVLNKTQGEYSDSNPFNNSAPTSTTFELDSWDRVNASGSDYVAFLFASANDADGNPISKVGSYTGDGTSDHEITTGFQPRFVLLKRASGTANWYLMDTLRGMGNTSTHRLKLNTDAAQDEPAGGPYVVPVSTGFDVRKETSEWNNNGDTYIYYAHA